MPSFWKPKVATSPTANSAPPVRQFSAAANGFTLLELMVVIAIIIVLAGVAAGHYFQTVGRAREAVLRSDLHAIRDAIEKYTYDKEAAPNSLDDLVQGGYLSQVPKDPITNAPDWTTDTCNTVLTPEQSSVGICDVHSASDKSSPFDGTPYSSW
jgi:general secretion pathway protein G